MLPNIQYIVMFNDAALNVYTDGKDVEIVMPTKVTIIKGGNSRRRSRRNTNKINKRTKGTKHRNRKIKNRTKKYKK